MLNLTSQQLQDILNHKSQSEEGINEILTAVLNAIMHAERQAYLSQSKDPANKGNGYRPIKVQGYGKLLSLAIPRDRLGLFRPLLMLTLQEEEQETKNLCFELYKAGLTTRNVAKVFERLYGTRYSKTTISLMSQTFKEELEEWRRRPLEKRYLVLYLDGIHTKVKRDTVEGEAFFVALAVKEDGTREVIALENNPTEHADAWESVLANIKERGVEQVDLVVADGLPGLEEKVLSLFPKAAFQKCVTHLKRNILNKVRPSDKAGVAAILQPIFKVEDNAHTKQKAYIYAEEVIQQWGGKYPFLAKQLSQENLRPYLTCLDCNFKVRQMIYTTNWVERLNKRFRQALKVRNSMPSVASVFLLLAGIARDLSMSTYAYPVHSLINEPIFTQPALSY